MVEVIAVDPGLKCGVATWRDGTISAIQCDYGTALDEHIIPVLYRIPRVCSVERYTIGAQTLKKTRQPTALHVIGVIKKICADEEIHFVQYPPGDAKRLGSVALLKQLGLYLPGLDHANDALSHLLLTLANLHRSVFVALLKSGTVNIT